MARVELKNPSRRYQGSFTLLLLIGIAAFAFVFGLMVSSKAHAKSKKSKNPPRVIYPKKTELDYTGLNLEGELKNPAELYFQVRPQEKFDSLVKRRKNFHREMLRDVVMSK